MKKWKIFGIVLAVMIVGGMIVGPQEKKSGGVEKKKHEVEKNQINFNRMEQISQLQEHFLNKKLTKELLEKYPSFNTITFDSRPKGGNIYYIYSKKFDIELKIKDGVVDMLWEGSRFENR